MSLLFNMLSGCARLFILFLPSLPFAPFGLGFGLCCLCSPPPLPTGTRHPSPGCVEGRVPWKPHLRAWNQGHIASARHPNLAVFERKMTIGNGHDVKKS